jgi:nucleoside-diphosphate-sugar epimerase
MSTWLLTGANGFVGGHVLDALSGGARGLSPTSARVLLLGRRRPRDWPEDAFITADLTEPTELLRAVQATQPDFVIHTAGKTPPAPDEELYRANFWATVHLLNALRALDRPMRVVVSGSAAELGPVEPAALPVNEAYTGYPREAYGRSKSLATKRALAEPPPLQVMVARLFNPIGPRMPGTQAFGRFAARLCDPTPDPLNLEVGDLDARRDFVDVRDVASALIALAERGHAGLAYHVGTGESRRVGEGLDRLVRLSGRTACVKVDPQLFARRGSPDSRADISRIVGHTGWRPAIPWEQTLEDLWRAAVAHQPSPRPRGELAA